MLHSSAGAFTLKSTDEPSEDNFGEKTLARNCFAVVLPHYLEALGHKSMISKPEMIANFPEMLEITESLLTSAEAHPWVKGQPVLLFGESLGGYLSVALALRRSEVMAVSEMSGGLPAGYASDNPHSFNILISHGIDDTLVPVKEAMVLNAYCTNHNLSVDMNLYPRVGHYLSRPVQTQVISKTVEYFLKQAGRG
jgi:predicted esterase